MKRPTQPIWRGDHEEWKREIHSFNSVASDPLEALIATRPISDQAWAVAIAVFHTAADYNTMYRAPLRGQLHAWGKIFDNGWLTVELAERAVEEHMSQDLFGRLLPFHVLRNATLIKLEEGC